jgi:hypothetical protein
LSSATTTLRSESSAPLPLVVYATNRNSLQTDVHTDMPKFYGHPRTSGHGNAPHRFERNTTHVPRKTLADTDGDSPGRERPSFSTRGRGGYWRSILPLLKTRCQYRRYLDTVTYWSTEPGLCSASNPTRVETLSFPPSSNLLNAILHNGNTPHCGAAVKTDSA